MGDLHMAVQISGLTVVLLAMIALMSFAFVDGFAVAPQMVFTSKLFPAVRTRKLSLHVDRLDVTLHVLGKRKLLRADVTMVHLSGVIPDHMRI